jgi:hypothetical protein
MSRGFLGEDGLAEISLLLPDLTDLRDVILNLLSLNRHDFKRLYFQAPDHAGIIILH